MAGFTVKGLPELEKQFANLSTIPAEVIWKMLDAEADVVVAAQRATAASMLAGRFNKGAVQRAIKKGKIKLVKGVYTQYINYTGRQHGNRIAEIHGSKLHFESELNKGTLVWFDVPLFVRERGGDNED